MRNPLKILGTRLTELGKRLAPDEEPEQAAEPAPETKDISSDPLVQAMWEEEDQALSFAPSQMFSEEDKHKPTRDVLLQKHERLKEIADTLKQEFIGLDHIIDEAMVLISPWYLFPQAQLRPTIINLWGMTGTGKSAMVKRLVDLLGYNSRFVYFDMGEGGSEHNGTLKDSITTHLSFFQGKESILCFDEFQFARTIDDNGNEIAEDNLRVVWELLDSGKFFHLTYCDDYLVRKTQKLTKLLRKCKKQGVIVKKGRIEDGLETFQSLLHEFHFGYYIEDKDAVKQADYFISSDFINGIDNLIGELFSSRTQIKRKVERMDMDELLRMLQFCIEQQTSMEELDFSQALIFNIGNLDEAFYMSKNMNPDISADDFHREAQKVTLPDIKEALKNRFRIEQIARMGNNHLIYPAFSKSGYEQFIQMELERIIKSVDERFGLTIQFSPSVAHMVYQEGVFPTQGARPVLTTIRNQIEAYIGIVICRWMENELPATLIDWSYDNGHYTIRFLKEDGSACDEMSIELRLKVNNLRKTKADQIQAHTAVHEAGHAVLAAMTLRIIPECILTQTAVANAQGFCQINLPEDVETFEILKKQIMIDLGGYLAEQLIFGKEHLSTGSVSDLNKCTQRANAAVRTYGMVGPPRQIRLPIAGHEEMFFYAPEHGKQAETLITACMDKAIEVLETNKRFLLELAEYLSIHSRMDKEQIHDMAVQYAAEEWVQTEGFIQKENYFHFKESLADALASCKNESEDPEEGDVIDLTQSAA
jgi:cell division protease FtsH